jgi:hypothetical protein
LIWARKYSGIEANAQQEKFSNKIQIDLAEIFGFNEAVIAM